MINNFLIASAVSAIRRTHSHMQGFALATVYSYKRRKKAAAGNARDDDDDDVTRRPTTVIIIKSTQTHLTSKCTFALDAAHRARGFLAVAHTHTYMYKVPRYNVKNVFEAFCALILALLHNELTCRRLCILFTQIETCKNVEKKQYQARQQHKKSYKRLQNILQRISHGCFDKNIHAHIHLIQGFHYSDYFFSEKFAFLAKERF